MCKFPIKRDEQGRLEYDLEHFTEAQLDSLAESITTDMVIFSPSDPGHTGALRAAQELREERLRRKG